MDLQKRWQIHKFLKFKTCSSDTSFLKFGDMKKNCTLELSSLDPLNSNALRLGAHFRACHARATQAIKNEKYLFSKRVRARRFSTSHYILLIQEKLFD